MGRCPPPPAGEATGPAHLPSLLLRGVRVHSPVMLNVDPKVLIGPASHCSPQAARTGLCPKTRDRCLLARYKPGVGRGEGRSPGGPELALTPKSAIRQGGSKPGLQGWPRTPGETVTPRPAQGATSPKPPLPPSSLFSYTLNVTAFRSKIVRTLLSHCGPKLPMASQ